MFKQLKTKSIITFRQWSRKAYAVFNSLNKVVRIGVLGLGCSILSLPAKSQQTGIDHHRTDSLLVEQELEEVVVSAQRNPVLQSELMRVVHIISRAEIEQSPAGDLAGLLQSLSAVDVRTRGSFGMQSDISLRGGTFDQTMILINGVNITDPQTGHHNLNVPVDLQSIERIEVLHGPGARVFGPNAFNGAINIITREEKDPFFQASVTGGEYGFGAAGLTGGFATGSADHHLSLSGITSDGFTRNTDFQAINVYYRSRVKSNTGLWDAQAGYNQKAFGANSFYTPAFPDQFEETSTRFASLQWIDEGTGNARASIYWRGHTDRFELFRDKEGAPDWYTGHNHHKTNVAGLNASYFIGSSLGVSTLGVDYRLEHILSNVLGEPLDQPIDVNSWPDAQYTHSYIRQGLGILLEHNVYRGNFSASAGTLLYFNSDLVDQPGLFPGLDLAWQMHPQIRWFASTSRTLRLPTFTDLFYSGGGILGNPYLMPEEAISAETGWKLSRHNVRAEVSLFRRWGSNMIDWVKSPGEELWQSMNHTRINISGIETSLFVPLYQNPQVLISRVALNMQYSYIHADKLSGELISNYVMDHLKHKLTAGWNLHLNSRGGINISTSWQQRNGSYIVYRDNTFAESKEFKPYLLLDARIFYRFQRLEVFSEGSNLLDATVVSVANVPQPGRWLRIGLNFGI